jgi:HlyD family secretion protein
MQRTKPHPKKKEASKRPPIGLVAFLVVALVEMIVIGYGFWLKHQANQPHLLHLSGTIEATTSSVGFNVGGRVMSRPVDEGDVVHQGQVLAILDDTTLREQVRAREAELAVARAAHLDTRQGPRASEIQAGKATLAQARALAAASADRRARTIRLFKGGGISSIEYTHTLHNDDEARARVDEANARLKSLLEGTRPAQIAQAAARVKQAEAALALAQANLAYATVRSPMEGVVLAKHVEPGEVVAPGAGAVTIAKLNDVYLRVYVPEAQLGLIKLGQKAGVKTDTYPGKVYPGRVSYLSSEAEFTPRTVQTPEERVKLVYRVKIDVPNPAFDLKPGMPADAVIEVGEGDRK